MSDPWVAAAIANTDAIRAEVDAGHLDPVLARALVIADTLGASMDPNCPAESSTVLAESACQLAQAFRADRLGGALLDRDPIPDDIGGLDDA